ncbi:MAG: TIGR01212 family radical SAM protein [Candidatus Omnitrophica bacterium]|nr:TIGR01212 family radical SAM protein [Candidatus Omnitrophota bacterium]
MRYYSFNKYLRERHGVRVHRLSLNAGFTCPNRDGSISGKGCIYCNSEGFSFFGGDKLPTIEEQIAQGMAFARERYGAGKFIAYFQTGTNTYGPVDKLKKTYDVISRFPDIVGLYISTRPDCIDDEKLDLIKSYADRYEVWIEYGVQTVHDKTLELIERGHDFETARLAILKTASKGIKVAAHLIIGLPGEDEAMMAVTAKTMAKLPISGVKFHSLHVLECTKLADMYQNSQITIIDRETYIDRLIKFLEYLPKTTVIFRLVSDARPETLIAPYWMRDKHQVIQAIEREMESRNIRQGALNK